MKRPGLRPAERWLVDEAYRDAEMIRVALDNLKTNTPASLYASFPAREARRLVRNPELQRTQKYGSWLNVAECELAVLATQCLERRLPDLETVLRADLFENVLAELCGHGGQSSSG